MSYAMLPARKVADACRAYLHRRDLRIEQEREEMIAAQMGAWLFPAKTREQAIRRLQPDDIWSKWNLVSIRGGYWADEVAKLLSLAEMAGDGEVHVSDDVAGRIENYYAKPPVRPACSCD